MSAQLFDVLARIREEASLVSTERWGFPVGNHTVWLVNPAREEPDVQAALGSTSLAELTSFYSICDGISLPDVHVGYFVSPLHRIVSGRSSDLEPSVLAGESQGRILCFGSDGGGGRFAVRELEQSIVYLKSHGAVWAARFEDTGGLVVPVASSLIEFLRRLEHEVRSEVTGVACEHLAP